MAELRLESRSSNFSSLLGSPLVGVAFIITFEVTVTFEVVIGGNLIINYVI